MITFQWEPLRKLLKEPNTNDMLLAHWRELGVYRNQMPLDPDYQLMANAEDAGLFRVWTARDKKLLVGYIAFWIRPHIHYKSTLSAFDDLYILLPEYRKGWTGVRFWASALKALREMGVKHVVIHVKHHFAQERGGLDKLFRRLGFDTLETTYSRML